MWQEVKNTKKLYLYHATLSVPLVNCKFHLIATSHFEKTVNSKDFMSVFPHEEHIKDLGYYGMTFSDYPSGQYGIVLPPEGLNHNVIAHEIHHATNRIGGHIGCTNTPNVSEEFYATIAGWLGETVHTQLTEWGLKLRPFFYDINPVNRSALK